MRVTVAFVQQLDDCFPTEADYMTNEAPIKGDPILPLFRGVLPRFAVISHIYNQYPESQHCHKHSKYIRRDENSPLVVALFAVIAQVLRTLLTLRSFIIDLIVYSVEYLFDGSGIENGQADEQRG